jgi:hypothetical protein
MSRISREHEEVIKTAAQAGIIRSLKARYSELVERPLPSTLAALLTRLESADLIARNVARLNRLRRGLTARKK